MKASQILKDLPLEQQTALIGNLPKVDLHRHLEGAIRPEFILELVREYQLELPSTLDELRPLVQVTPDTRSLVDFLTKFEPLGQLFTSYQLIETIAQQCVLDAQLENVKYLELRFSPAYIANFSKLEMQDVVDAIAAGVAKGQEQTGVAVSLILIVARQMDIEIGWQVARLAVENKDKVVALDLADDEYNFPPQPFAPMFQFAKEHGLKITVHAGEAAGPENIRTAIEDLQADRIGHGVRLYQDPELEKLIAQRGIPLELCFTSNLQTQAVSSSENYPLRRYLDLGIKATLNTDDPGISGINLIHEYLLAVEKCNLTLEDLITLSKNAINVAFITPELRTKLLGDLSFFLDNLN